MDYAWPGDLDNDFRAGEVEADGRLRLWFARSGQRSFECFYEWLPALR